MGFLSDIFGGASAPPPRNLSKEYTKTLNAQISNAPAQFSAESQWDPRYAQLGLSNLGISLLGTGGQPGMLALNRMALDQSDPETAGLLSRLTSDATAQYGMGSQLDPSQFNLVTQDLRSRMSGMLGGTGNAGAYSEALGLSAYGNQLRQQRMQNASNVVALRNRIYGNPSTIPMAAGISGGPRIFNPESPYAQDVYNTNYNASAAANIASANNRAGILGGLMQGGSALGAAAILA